MDEAHAAFFAALMRESLGLFVRGEQDPAMTIVEHDLDNVRSAWRYYLATGNAAGARPFVEGLWYLYEIRGWYPAAIDLFGEALEAFPSESEDASVVTLRDLAGATQAWFHALMGQPEAGEAVARIAAERLHDSSDLDGYMTAAQCWAISLAYLGRMDEMAACMEAAIGRRRCRAPRLLVCRDAKLAILRRGPVGGSRDRERSSSPRRTPCSNRSTSTTSCVGPCGSRR